MDYLFEQLGPDFIRLLSANPKNGLASIDSTLENLGSPRTADDLYVDALTAAFFNNPELAEGQFAYQYPILPAVVPRYAFNSIPAIFQEEMYPPGCETAVEVGSIAARLEGERRPGHFRGVATVVVKLFGIFCPTRAYFGEKDAHQLVVIRREVQDLNVPLEIIGCRPFARPMAWPSAAATAISTNANAAPPPSSFVPSLPREIALPVASTELENSAGS